LHNPPLQYWLKAKQVSKLTSLVIQPVMFITNNTVAAHSL